MNERWWSRAGATGAVLALVVTVWPPLVAADGAPLDDPPTSTTTAPTVPADPVPNDPVPNDPVPNDPVPNDPVEQPVGDPGQDEPSTDPIDAPVEEPEPITAELVESWDGSLAAPQAAGTLRVTPSTGLVDLQVVNIAGSRWGAGTTLGALMCEKSGINASCDLGTLEVFEADATGRFNRPFIVDTVITGSGTSFDCRAVTCVIGVSTSFATAGERQVDLGFDPSAPVRPPPTFTVTPSTGLVDGQMVDIEGSGFRPYSFVSTLQCRLPVDAAAPACQQTSSGFDADADGSILGTMQVEAIIRTYGPSGATDVDCRVDTCGVVLAHRPDLTAPVALTFDPDAPLRPPPTLSATPSDGLHDAEVIRIEGSGYGPYSFVELTQCAAGVDEFERCSFGGWAIADEDGDISGRFVVRTQLGLGIDRVDCRVASCTLFAFDEASFGIFRRAGSVDLGFDPDAPVGVTPMVDVEPATDLTDGDLVSVEGAGFRPEALLGMVQCVADPGDQSGCDLGTLSYATATGPEIDFPDFPLGLGRSSRNHQPEFGGFEASFTVKRTLSLGDGRTIDCAVTPCMLGVGDVDQLDASVAVPLSFRPGGPRATIVGAVGPVVAAPGFAG